MAKKQNPSGEVVTIRLMTKTHPDTDGVAYDILQKSIGGRDEIGGRHMNRTAKHVIVEALLFWGKSQNKVAQETTHDLLYQILREVADLKASGLTAPKTTRKSKNGGLFGVLGAKVDDDFDNLFEHFGKG